MCLKDNKNPFHWLFQYLNATSVLKTNKLRRIIGWLLQNYGARHSSKVIVDRIDEKSLRSINYWLMVVRIKLRCWYNFHFGVEFFCCAANSLSIKQLLMWITARYCYSSVAKPIVSNLNEWAFFARRFIGARASRFWRKSSQNTTWAQKTWCHPKATKLLPAVNWFWLKVLSKINFAFKKNDHPLFVAGKPFLAFSHLEPDMRWIRFLFQLSPFALVIPLSFVTLVNINVWKTLKR